MKIEQKSKYTWLIDNGHGGMIDGEYVTAPAKMYDHGDFVFYEGVWNRKVAKVLCDLLASAGIKHKLLVPQEEDVSIRERVRRANELHLDKANPVIFLSIHANAGGGIGYEIFTSVGDTQSDDVADSIIEGYEVIFPNRKQRRDLSDGDKDKEAQFYVLRNTGCPAVLTESGFMDNYDEAKYMMSEEGVIKFARAHFEGIKLYEKIVSL